MTWIISFYGLSFAWNEFSYENAKTLAKDYITNSSFDENWKDKHPQILWEWKYFYTDAETPSYIEFKVTCDNNPNCWFIMVNFDWDDVSIPIASTDWSTPSEILVAKNGNIDSKETKLYYFNPFEQYAENELTWNVSSIDPQDDYVKESANSIQTESKTAKLKEKTDKNKVLKNKILSAKKEAKDFKKSDDFKSKVKDLKKKKQTVKNEEVSFKYLDLALAEEDPTVKKWYTPPASTDIYIPWSNTKVCWSRTPCYNQFYTTYNWVTCKSWCSPTAMWIIFWYYDKTFNSNINYNNLLPWTTIDYLNDSDSNTMIKKIWEYMWTFCNGNAWDTYPSNFTKWIQYAKDKWYSNSKANYIKWTTDDLFKIIKSEINSGRPVMASNKTHSMVAYWYNSTSGLPIVRLNMWWGAWSKITWTNWVEYTNTNIDYNMNALFYNWIEKTAIQNIVTIKIIK